jgi:MFS family permease
VSVVPLAFVVAAALLTAFVLVEVRKERADRDPLFEFSQLRHRGFRYGLLTTMVLAMGQFALLFVVPVWLQAGEGFSALRAGGWMVPTGVLIAIGAPIGGRMSHRFTLTAIVRWGLALEALGLVLVAVAVDPGASFWALLPGSVTFGLGVGFASSQLTNVILSEIEPARVGVASGTNTTVRQVGLALGIATFAAFLNALTISHATSRLRDAALDPGVRIPLLDQLREKGLNLEPPSGASLADRATVHDILRDAVAAGARPALIFAAAVVTLGTVLSFLIPKVTVARVSASVEPEVP